MSGWNFAEVWEIVAAAGARRPGPGPGRPPRHLGGVRPAGQRRRPGACSTPASSEQDKVAQYLYNGPEYLESMFATFKAGLAPINTNYRYVDDELVYLWDNADAVAVVFHGTFAERIEGIRDRVPRVHDLAVGRRRRRPVPRLGHALRGRPPRPAPRARSRARGAAAATTCSCSTPAAPPACPRA